MAPNGNRCVLYTCLSDICFGAWDASGSLMFVKTVRLPWKQGEWRQVALSWGKQLEVSVDGQKKISTPWDGLFGPLAAERDKLRLYVGHWYSGAVECEYTIDELAIMGPRPDNMACRPRASVPLLEGAPKLDGKLDDPFWQKAGKLTGFVGLVKRELNRVQPNVLAAYTDAGLYLGATVPLPEGRGAQATLTAHNSSIYTEDTIELFMQPSLSSPACFQLLANAIGTKAEIHYDEKGGQVKDYNPDWQVATSSKEGEWTAEIFIPYKAIGLSGPPKAGDVWARTSAWTASAAPARRERGRSRPGISASRSLSASCCSPARPGRCARTTSPRFARAIRPSASTSSAIFRRR